MKLQEKIQNGGSGGVVRPSIRDSQSLDSGPNPDRSILHFVPDNLLFSYSFTANVSMLPEEVMSSNFFIADCTYQNVFLAISLLLQVALLHKNAISLHFFHSLLRMISLIRARANNIARMIAMSRKRLVKF